MEAPSDSQIKANALDELLSPYAHRTEADLRRWLVEPGVPAELADAMRYCTTGGKRFRAALVQMACFAAGGDEAPPLARRAAVAVELIHAYSLVHDDLPAMDDDALRRGQPTAHVQFGEAMAILVGDALLTRAFGVLAETEDERTGRLVRELASGAGAAGMVAGQVADMDLCRLSAGAEGLRYVHLHKTASLIRASARMGAICSGADERTLAAIGDCAEAMGLAFQVFDDVLDVVGGAEELGKTPGKDARSEKRTYPAQLGLEDARKLGGELTTAAIEALAPLGEAARTLRTLATLLAERTH